MSHLNSCQAFALERYYPEGSEMIHILKFSCVHGRSLFFWITFFFQHLAYFIHSWSDLLYVNIKTLAIHQVQAQCI